MALILTITEGHDDTITISHGDESCVIKLDHMVKGKARMILDGPKTFNFLRARAKKREPK